MLRYLGTGQRFYGESPMPPHARMNWEFQAVVKGKMAPITGQKEPLASNALWVFPPGVAHGWRSEAGETCEIISLHFSEVPRTLELLAAKRGYLRVKLSRSSVRQLVRLAKSLLPHYWHPVASSEVYALRALVELCLLVLRKNPAAQERRPLGNAFTKVSAAEDWLRFHLARGAQVRDAAKANGLSVSQLNRLFRRIRGETPQEFLVHLKIERAMRLLSDARLKLETVATESGFTSASNLCRAFKAAKGISPTRWRDETLIRYRRPRPGSADDPGSHGRRDRRGM